MKTRVRPLREECLRNWAIEVFDPVMDKWVVNSEHNFFWKANWKAYRLSKYSLAVKQNKKEIFVERLKNGDEQGE